MEYALKKSLMSYFYGSFIFTFFGLVLSCVVGHYYGGDSKTIFEFLFLTIILSLLEVSISFDNAVVNATVLKDMTPLWQKRFLTWGMLIAVFGMRFVFPLVIVSLAASLGPLEALKLAVMNPDEYAKIMLSVEHEVAAFGGAFLFLVAFKYFFDSEKDIHWLKKIEEPLVKLGKLEAVEITLVLAILIVFSKLVEPQDSFAILFAGILGIISFAAVEAISHYLQVPEAGVTNLHKASLSMFLYLQVLDSSFSFDGVIGAFAITNNLFIITIGLSIGAMFVRSLTIMMVERGALDAFKYLEHGAFYAVGSLALIMFLNTITHIPEVISGIVGVVLIGLSIWASFRDADRVHGKNH